MVPRNAETGSGMPQGTNSRNPSGYYLKVGTHSSPMPEENQPRRAAFLGSEPQLLLLPSLSSYQRREWRLEVCGTHQRSSNAWLAPRWLPQLPCPWNWTRFPWLLLCLDTAPRWPFTIWNAAWYSLEGRLSFLACSLQSGVKGQPSQSGAFFLGFFGPPERNGWEAAWRAPLRR